MGSIILCWNREASASRNLGLKAHPGARGVASLTTGRSAVASKSLLRSVPPKEMAQIQAAQRYARMPGNGVRIKHKCQILASPCSPATCTQACPSPT